MKKASRIKTVMLFSFRSYVYGNNKSNEKPRTVIFILLSQLPFPKSIIRFAWPEGVNSKIPCLIQRQFKAIISGLVILAVNCTPSKPVPLAVPLMM
jgi:hypothetical protein